MSAVKKQRTGFPDATLKNLVKEFINGPSHNEISVLKDVWVKEFESVEGADNIKQQQQLGYSPLAMKGLKKSLRKYSKFLAKLKASPTSEAVVAIYHSLSVALPDGSLDDQIQHLTNVLQVREASTRTEVEQMLKVKSDHEEICKQYLALRKVAYKVWRTDYSSYLKYLKAITDAEIKSRFSVREAELGHKPNAAEKRLFNLEVRQNLENSIHDRLVGRAEIFSYFSDVAKRDGFSVGDAERYSRIFVARRDIGKLKVTQHRVSNSGTVCARLAELITADIVGAITSAYGKNLASDANTCAKAPSPPDLATAKLSDSYLPFVQSSETYKNVLAGHGVTLHPKRAVLLPYVKKTRKSICNNIKFSQELMEIISSMVCEFTSSFVLLALRNSDKKSKTISADNLLGVLRVRFENQPADLERFSAIVESAYAPKKRPAGA
jgi:hypothetical protein